MISFQQFQEKVETASKEIKNLVSSNTIRNKILDQLAGRVSQREENFGNIRVGIIVESNSEKFEVLRVESSYIHVVSSDGKLQKKWLHECKAICPAADTKPTIKNGQILFKGYLSKSLTEDTVAYIFEKCLKSNSFLLLSFLSAHDKMVESTDVVKQKQLVEQTFKFSEKLGIPTSAVMNELDDTMILECAQGNISYSAPNPKKIKEVIASLGIQESNKYSNEIITNLIRMIKE